MEKLYRRISVLMKIKKSKGNASVNVVIFLLFICTIVSSTTIILKSRNRLILEDDALFKNDYKYEYTYKVVKLNFYNAIEEAYEKSNKDDEFSKYFSKYSTEYFRKVFQCDYYKDEKVQIEKIENDKSESNIEIKEEYIEFYITVKYNEKGAFRAEILKCRIYNPYKKFDDIYENEDKTIKRNLSKNDVKTLFKILY